MADGRQPRRPVQGGAEVVALAFLRIARVQGHPHPDRGSLRPQLVVKAGLGATAAASASPARANAAANPSPPVENTYPPCAWVAARTMSSWRATARRIASVADAHSRVDPSMSVNRKVTVPEGAPTAPA
jgi:hypothetical protein